MAEAASGQTTKKKRRSRKKKKPSVFINLSNCKYEVVYDVAEERGWKVVDEEDEIDWNVYWTDTSVSTERVMRLQKFQKINHFPGMYQLARKAELARNLSRMQAVFPEEYVFFPKTWVLPCDFADFKSQFSKGKGNKTFIVKPDNSCQGKGIFLTRSWENVDMSEVQVAQRYLHKPLLIDSFKFDLRVYALVLSCDPLRILLYEDGLTRICTEKYTEPTNKNLHKSCVHLTNYAINKHNKNFVQNEGDGGSGNKRSIQWFREWLDEEGHDSQAVWKRIGDMIVKTLISVQPSLSHIYKSCSPDDNDGFSCFEILGFDVMIDRKLQPWLIEVNHSPSFSCDSPLDQQIKEGLITDVMTLLNVNPYDKRRHRQKMQAEAQQRLYGGKKQTGRTAADTQQAEEEVLKAIAKQEKVEKKCSETFTLIYPPNNEADQENFLRLLGAAQDLFENTTSAPVGIRRMRQMGRKIIASRQADRSREVEGEAATPTAADKKSKRGGKAAADASSADDGGDASASPKKTPQELQIQQQVATAVKKMQLSLAEEGRRREEEEEFNSNLGMGTFVSNNESALSSYRSADGSGSDDDDDDDDDDGRKGNGTGGLPQCGAPAVTMRKERHGHMFNRSGIRVPAAVAEAKRQAGGSSSGGSGGVGDRNRSGRSSKGSPRRPVSGRLSRSSPMGNPMRLRPSASAASVATESSANNTPLSQESAVESALADYGHRLGEAAAARKAKGPRKAADPPPPLGADSLRLMRLKGQTNADTDADAADTEADVGKEEEDEEAEEEEEVDINLIPDHEA